MPDKLTVEQVLQLKRAGFSDADIRTNYDTSEYDAWESRKRETVARATSPEARQRDWAEVNAGGSGFARAVQQGASFGFADELDAAAGALGDKLFRGKSFIDSYKMQRDAIRDADREYEAENPGAALAGNLVGGLLLPVGAAGAAARGVRGAAAAARALQMGKGAVVSGAAGGAIAGVGGANSLEDVPETAVLGALVGAVTGGALKYGGKLGQKALDVTGLRPEGAPTGAIGRVLDAIGVRPASKDEEGARLAAEALQMDGVTPDELIRRSAGAARSGKPMIVADIGGKNAARTLDAAALGPSAEKDVIATKVVARADETGQRLARDLQDAAGMERTSTFDEMRATNDARQAGNNANFEALRPQPLPQEAVQGLSPVLRRLRPEIESIWATLQDQDRLAGRAVRPDLFGKRGQVRRDLTIGDVEDLRQGFGSMIPEAPPQDVGQRRTWTALTVAKQQFLGAVDNAPGMGEYAAARGWSGEMRDVQAAYAAGERTLRGLGEPEKRLLFGQDARMRGRATPEDVVRAMRSKPEEVQAAWRQGLLNDIVARLESSTPQRARDFLARPDIQPYLRELVRDPQARKQLGAAFEAEGRMLRTTRATQGSLTQERGVTRELQYGDSQAPKSLQEALFAPAADWARQTFRERQAARSGRVLSLLGADVADGARVGDIIRGVLERQALASARQRGAALGAGSGAALAVQR